jgi:hypothetical protein
MFDIGEHEPRRRHHAQAQANQQQGCPNDHHVASIERKAKFGRDAGDLFMAKKSP